MNEFVKNFIKNTQYLINKNMWSTFFYEWYRECAKVWPAQNIEKELFSILKQAEISVDWDARKLVIIKAVENIIEEVLTNLDAWREDYIPIKYIVSELMTTMHLTDEKLEDCIQAAADKFNLELSDDNKSYNII